MPEERIRIGIENRTALYKNASVSKVHDSGLYDVKFSNGRIKNYVENVSANTFSSGEYVAVVISFDGSDEIYKIIGKGRKIREYSNIESVRV